MALLLLGVIACHLAMDHVQIKETLGFLSVESHCQGSLKPVLR